MHTHTHIDTHILSSPLSSSFQKGSTSSLKKIGSKSVLNKDDAGKDLENGDVKKTKDGEAVAEGDEGDGGDDDGDESDEVGSIAHVACGDRFSYLPFL
jgi:hypothetical protein